MKVLSVLMLFVGLGISSGAWAQGVGGSGGTERDVVDLPVKLASYTRPANGYDRYPYYPSQVTCQALQGALRDNRELVIFTKPHLFAVYGTRWARCGGTNMAAVETNLRTKDGQCPVYKCTVVYND